MNQLCTFILILVFSFSRSFVYGQVHFKPDSLVKEYLYTSQDSFLTTTLKLSVVYDEQKDSNFLNTRNAWIINSVSEDTQLPVVTEEAVWHQYKQVLTAYATAFPRDTLYYINIKQPIIGKVAVKKLLAIMGKMDGKDGPKDWRDPQVMVQLLDQELFFKDLRACLTRVGYHIKYIKLDQLIPLNTATIKEVYGLDYLGQQAIYLPQVMELSLEKL